MDPHESCAKIRRLNPGTQRERVDRIAQYRFKVLARTNTPTLRSRRG
jgi:hypothetical protein